ncbi:MAG: pentapeptide repeat-containing protein [Pseudomonadota bacterium]
MAEYGSSEADVETPVNPYSLLEAVNRSSDMAHMGWLIFLGVMAYLLIAVAGVSHKDLLLEEPVQLPIFGIDVPLIQFFQFAPILLVLFHLGITSQLVLLARKTLEFDLAVQQLESTVKRTHPLRLELNNFFFVQGIAGPDRSLIMSAFLHAMSWLTLVVIPVLVLLFIQVAFLPYHSAEVTWAHRVALMVDIIMLLLIGVFLIRPESSFFRAAGRTITTHPLGVMITTAVFIAVSAFSFLVATIPGEALDRFVAKVRKSPTGDLVAAQAGGTPPIVGFALPSLFVREDGSLFGLFYRNLDVADLDLVADKEITKGEATFSLRDRDLRYARFDRSDLRQVDLTRTKLQFASFVRTDLRNANLQCIELIPVIIEGDREKGECVEATGADFSRADMRGAQLAGSDYAGAIFTSADLRGADMRHTSVIGAKFDETNLQRANLSGGILAQGADFLLAKLEGADMNGAQLQGSNFLSASMQGVDLSHAQLEGVSLQEADLEGAVMLRSKLQGANLTGANLVAVDLRWAEVWMTEPPNVEKTRLSDMSDVTIRPIPESRIGRIKAAVRRIPQKPVRDLVNGAIEPPMNIARSEKWRESDNHQLWRDIVLRRGTSRNLETYAPRLTSYLADLACRKRWQDGSVATGIVRRAGGQLFRGDLASLRTNMTAGACKSWEAVSPSVMQQFSTRLDESQG